MRIVYLFLALACVLIASGRVRADEIKVSVKESGPTSPGLFTRLSQWNAERARVKWVKPQPAAAPAPAERKPERVAAEAPEQKPAAAPVPAKQPLRIVIERN